MNTPTVTKLFDMVHPMHGYYSVWFDVELQTFGISKSDQPCWCGYSSLSELFKVKGL